MEEYSVQLATLLTVGQVEIFVAPLLEPQIAFLIMCIAGFSDCPMKMNGVLFRQVAWCEVGSAA